MTERIKYTTKDTIFLFLYGKNEMERSYNYGTREAAERAAAEIRATGVHVGTIQEHPVWPYRQACSYHVNHEFKSYRAFEKHAKAREALGEKATQCDDCAKFLFPNQMGKRPRGFRHPGARVHD